jgi:hypothetical protein
MNCVIAGVGGSLDVGGLDGTRRLMDRQARPIVRGVERGVPSRQQVL